ncbi:MAG: ORF6N domain-containing protein [Elusimicrobiota bacterium]|jgi:hypothetical protein
MGGLLQDDFHNRIFRIRGQHVMLGPDLARLYGVQTKVLMQAVRRSLERFPPDFMFRLTWHEVDGLSTVRSQSVTLESHLRFRPLAFTEEGVAMLSAVLRSQTAIQISIAIIRAFVKLRHAVLAHQDLGRRIEKVEGRLHIAETDIRLVQEDVGRLKKKPSTPLPFIHGFEP